MLLLVGRGAGRGTGGGQGRCAAVPVRSCARAGSAADVRGRRRDRGRTPARWVHCGPIIKRLLVRRWESAFDRKSGGRGVYLSQLPGERLRAPTRRRFSRHQIQCRARICIAKRHYAGYLQNISRGGAKLRTITPIRRLGDVLLRLPDLPPLRCRLASATPTMPECRSKSSSRRRSFAHGRQAGPACRPPPSWCHATVATAGPPREARACNPMLQGEAQSGPVLLRRAVRGLQTRRDHVFRGRRVS